MVDINKVKEEVRSLVSEASRSAHKIEDTIVSCDTFRMTFLLGDVDEVRGTTSILAKLYPEDKEIKQMFKDAASLHILAYKGRDKFIEQCECRKKQHISR